MCVLTNPADDAYMATDAGQLALAKGIFAGIEAALTER